MSRRHSPDALRAVREMYATHTAAQIARRIFGTPRAAKAVYRMAFALGLRKCPHHDPATYDLIRKLHAQGLPDRVIALRTGLTHDQAKDIRRVRLKLPTIGDIEGRRQCVRTQLKRMGLRHGGDLRAASYRKFARSRGWPEDLRPRAVQILELLAAEGRPMDRWEIAERIGWNLKRVETNRGGQRTLLHSNDPEGSYTANLIARGLLIVMPRALTVRNRGRGRSRHLYALSPAALEIIIRRASCPASTTT